MIRWVIAAMALVLAAPLAADELRPGSIAFTQRDAAEWLLAWKQPLVAAGRDALAVPIIPDACSYRADPVGRAIPGALVGEARVLCGGPVEGGTLGFEAIPGGGDVLLRVIPLDRPVQTFRLTEAEPVAAIAAQASAAQVWRSYFLLGVEHILEGWDHLLFVIALVLLVQRGWAVAQAVTAFTVAHSLTLAGVTLGLVGLPSRPVEALVALSIVLLAWELASPPDDKRETWTRRWPWLVAFGFGLIHGFGFAGALAEIGLPEGEVPAALISFNLGVEAGQLGVVAIVLLVLAAIRRVSVQAVAPTIRAASYAIGITGAYWLVDRLIG